MTTKSNDGLKYLSTVLHQTKLIQFGVKPVFYNEGNPEEGYYGKIYYSILETGQEPEDDDTSTEDNTSENTEGDSVSEDNVEDTGGAEIAMEEIPGNRWSAWKRLNLPNFKTDQSVIDKEAKDAEAYWNAYVKNNPGTDTSDAAKEAFLESQPPVRSLYDTINEGAFAPIQILASNEYLYVFRQSRNKTLLADRFILDGITNELIPKLEVRYKRSQQKFTPLKPSKNGQKYDTLDYRNANNEFFYEPSKEITLVNFLREAQFSVVLTPTYEHDKYCWHIFYRTEELDQLQLLSIRQSDEGWFNLNDHVVIQGDAEEPDLITMPGIISRRFNLQDDSDNPTSVDVADQFKASLYCLQEKSEDENGEEVYLKTDMRIMLAFPSTVDRKIATISFGVHRDGTLSKISEASLSETQLREEVKEVILPGNLLNNIQYVNESTVEESASHVRHGFTFEGEERIEVDDPFTGRALRDFTITCWLRPDRIIDNGSKFGICGGDPETAGKPTLKMIEGGQLRYNIIDDSGNTHSKIVDGAYFENELDWVHLSWVKTGTQFLFYRNGILTSTHNAPEKIMPIEGAFCIGRGGDKGQSWNGEIAAFSIWKKALSIDEILYLQDENPIGNEADLIGSWPLEGMLNGQTTDFSPFNNHGMVIGAYPAGHHLSPSMEDGSDVEVYRHPETVGVTQRGTYTESIEYLADPISDTPDGLQFNVWGTKGRDGEVVSIAISALQSYTKDLDDGWKKTTVRYTIPEGVTHLRYFEIQQPEGNWSTLKLRKHQIAQISKTVTRIEYKDNLILESLGDAANGNTYPNLNQTRQELAELQAEEAIHLRRLAELEALMEEEALASQQQKVDELEALVGDDGTLTQEKDQLLQDYEDEFNDFRNYYCSFTTKHTGKLKDEVMAFKSKHWDAIGHQPTSKVEYKWKIITYYNDSYVRFQSKDFPERYLTKKSGSNDIQLKKFVTEDRQRWLLQSAGGGYHKILAKNNTNKCVHLYSKDSNIYQEDYGSHTNQKWEIEPDEMCNDKIPNALAAYKAKVEEWTIKNVEYQQALSDLAALEANPQMDENSELVTQMNDVLDALAILQGNIVAINDQYLDIAEVLSNQVLTMPVANTDANDLKTNAALLDFAKCSGRLDAYESLLGAVQLDFFAESGAMRSCYFDAFNESWNPNLVLSCLNFNDDSAADAIFDDVAIIEKVPDFPSEELTFELWYRSREAKPSGTLFSYYEKESGHSLSISDVEDGIQIELNGFSISTDLVLQDVAWHHLALSFYAGEGVLRLYVDGVQKMLYDLSIYFDDSIDYKAIASGGAIALGQKIIAVTENPSGVEGQLYDYTFDTASAFTGQIANVRLWSVQLHADEIATQRHIHLTGNEPELVAYWPLSEAGTSGANEPDFYDQTGNGANGRLLGGASWFAGTMPIGMPTQEVPDFDGESQYIKSITEVDLSSGNFSVELWAKRMPGIDPNDSDDTQILWAHGTNGSGNALKFGFDKDGRFYIHLNGVGRIDSPLDATDHYWHHYAMTFDSVNAKIRLYMDGVMTVEAEMGTWEYEREDYLYLGCRGYDLQKWFRGRAADLRVWNKALTAEEVKSKYLQRLTGKEEDLILYWPLDKINYYFDDQIAVHIGVQSNDGFFKDLVGDNYGSTLNGNDTTPLLHLTTIQTAILPQSPSDAFNSGEYSVLQTDRQGLEFAILRRVYLYGTNDYINILASKRIEELEKRWLGNAQFAPTLLGYMEGAPPVPSENLTYQEDYRGATAVELKFSEDTVYRWNRTQQAGLGWHLKGELGFAANTTAGVSLGVSAEETVEIRALGVGEVNGQYSWLHESDVSSGVTLQQNDRLELKGQQEESALPNLQEQKRFLPKNVGYAVVVSSLADVFVFRLKKSGRMVGYEVSPVADIPPDINTITFMMNPAYTMNGTLDGQVGSAAADDTFYRHVPDMRAQYGSLYPASYYRLQEAYELKEKIQQEDADRESLFMNYNSYLVDETSLNNQVDDKKGDEGDAEGAIEDAEKNAETYSTSNSAGELEGWQAKMEDLALQAQKRNIVNTYVWDGDGGLRSETQQFATSVEQTIGGSFSLDGGLGFYASAYGAGLGFKMTAMATFHLTQSMKKTETKSKGFSMEIKVECENKGITDLHDRPLLPGEKVDRYRFMSFYLEAKTDHFNHFFNTVVDPVWLMSNDEEARALRGIDRTKPNKAWKVMHRVTYVERPALMAM